MTINNAYMASSTAENALNIDGGFFSCLAPYTDQLYTIRQLIKNRRVNSSQTCRANRLLMALEIQHILIHRHTRYTIDILDIFHRQIDKQIDRYIYIYQVNQVIWMMFWISFNPWDDVLPEKDCPWIAGRMYRKVVPALAGIPHDFRNPLVDLLTIEYGNHRDMSTTMTT